MFKEVTVYVNVICSKSLTGCTLLVDIHVV